MMLLLALFYIAVYQATSPTHPCGEATGSTTDVLASPIKGRLSEHEVLIKQVLYFLTIDDCHKLHILVY